ncbi:hypothetical protein G6F62_013272 [Rhizopus arrhizus]|nr:hypothetical protein G6F62_013272 [Rhizopus arrhizus]
MGVVPISNDQLGRPVQAKLPLDARLIADFNQFAVGQPVQQQHPAPGWAAAGDAGRPGELPAAVLRSARHRAARTAGGVRRHPEPGTAARGGGDVVVLRQPCRLVAAGAVPGELRCAAREGPRGGAGRERPGDRVDGTAGRPAAQAAAGAGPQR